MRNWVVGKISGNNARPLAPESFLRQMLKAGRLLKAESDLPHRLKPGLQQRLVPKPGAVSAGAARPSRFENLIKTEMIR